MKVKTKLPIRPLRRQRDTRPRPPSAFETAAFSLRVETIGLISQESLQRGVSKSAVVQERLARSYAEEAQAA